MPHEERREGRALPRGDRCAGGAGRVAQSAPDAVGGVSGRDRGPDARGGSASEPQAGEGVRKDGGGGAAAPRALRGSFTSEFAKGFVRVQIPRSIRTPLRDELRDSGEASRAPERVRPTHGKGSALGPAALLLPTPVRSAPPMILDGPHDFLSTRLRETGA